MKMWRRTWRDVTPTCVLACETLTGPELKRRSSSARLLTDT
jgi:hypothetical protein